MIYGLIFVGALASLLVHEFGHYVVARGLSVPVLQVTIGVGPEVLRFGSNCRWSVRLFPLGGSAQYAASNPIDFARTVGIVLAGPAANILIGTALFAGPAVEWQALIPLQEQLFRSAWMPALWFTGGLSLTIGIFNLLPLPPLDGGVLGLLVWQKVVGRPVSVNGKSAASALGALCLVLLTGFGLIWACVRIAS